MNKLLLVCAYFLLFPGVAIFYFLLMLVSEIGIGGFELSHLRPSGGPTLGNLVVEISIAVIIGILSALCLAIVRLSDRLLQEQKSIWRWVAATYFVVVPFYFLMPGLPE